MALSTLRPTTSPHISAIQLEFLPFPPNRRPARRPRPTEAAIRWTGDDLRQVAGEFARIEHEFKGAVKLTVSRCPVFNAVLNTLDVRFRAGHC